MLGALLLAWSCARVDVPGDTASDNCVIGFEASIEDLQSDGTRSTLVNGPGFTDGASFRVYGRRVGEGQNTRILGVAGTMVTWDSSEEEWSYSPDHYWYWMNAANYYDFLAAYPDPDGANQSSRMVDGSAQEIAGNLAIQKPYKLADDYDLMLAGTRRTGAIAATRTNPVPLTFQHMLCAVKVKVKNESSSASITLNSIKFDNLVHSANAKVTIDATGAPEFSWIDTQRKSDLVNYASPGSSISAGSSYFPAAFTLFIPADLTVAIDGGMKPDAGDYDVPADYETALTAYRSKIPHLIIDYSPSDGAVSIPLVDIQKVRYGTEDSISEWEMGVKYTYNITIRLDGNVIVTVITTEWDDVPAETPGLLID